MKLSGVDGGVAVSNSSAVTPEILAPVGSRESLVAAVAAKADAVYFGLKEFSARHRAANFELAELPELMRYLHRHGVKGYLAFNTLIFTSELESAAKCLLEAAKAGIDAVIVQDWGIVELLRKMIPALEIHGSTQMSQTEARGIRIVGSWGVERVVVGRELSLTEIEKIRAETTVPLEVFVHGAICVAYSGQCLTSEALGGRSANRGQCAQACRLPYEMLVDGEPIDLGDKSYLLSPQDLDARHLVGELSRIGISSLKIEGRLKGPEYVTTTVGAYRNALEQSKNQIGLAQGDSSWSPPWEETRDLALAFSRGFVPGFLEGVNHQRLVRGRFPKARGVYVGELVETHGSAYLIRLSDQDPDLAAGDGIVFDLALPQTKEPGGRVGYLKWRVDGLLEVRLERPNFSEKSIPPGTPIWKTDDPRFRHRIQARLSQALENREQEKDLRSPLDFILEGTAGGSLEIVAKTRTGAIAKAVWEGPLEKTQKPQPLDALAKSLGRIGDSPFSLGKIESKGVEGLYLPASQLNRLRREIIEQLGTSATPNMLGADVDALEKWNGEIAKRKELVNCSHTKSGPHLAVLLRNPDQVKALRVQSKENWPDRIWLDMEHAKDLRSILDDSELAELPLGVAGPRIIKPGEEGLIRSVLRSPNLPVLVRNLATWEIANEIGCRELVADFSLNLANSISADKFLNMGMTRVVASHDLHFAEWSKIAEAVGGFRVEAIVHFPMPMFHMEHCVYAAFLSSGHDYTDCGRPCEAHKVRMRDRAGSEFPVLVDAGCRNTVYNEVAQSALEYIPGMKRLGVEWFRLEFLHEKPETVLKTINVYRDVLSEKKDPKHAWREIRANNQFGLTRGTLRLL